MRPRISNQGARMDEVSVLSFNLLKTMKLSKWIGFGNGGSQSWLLFRFRTEFTRLHRHFEEIGSGFTGVFQACSIVEQTCRT